MDLNTLRTAWKEQIESREAYKADGTNGLKYEKAKRAELWFNIVAIAENIPERPVYKGNTDLMEAESNQLREDIRALEPQETRETYKWDEIMKLHDEFNRMLDNDEDFTENRKKYAAIVEERNKLPEGAVVRTAPTTSLVNKPNALLKEIVELRDKLNRLSS